MNTKPVTKAEKTFYFYATLLDWAGVEHNRRITVSDFNLHEAFEGLLWKVRNDFEGCELTEAVVALGNSSYHRLQVPVAA